MATSRQGDTADLAKSLPPELAEKLRQRRPGYDLVYKLVQEYESFPPNKRAQMAGSEVLDLFVQPMFQALGWSVEVDASGLALKSAPPTPAQQADLVLNYHDVRVSVVVNRFNDPPMSSSVVLTSDRWVLLTNFRTIFVWDYKSPDSPSLVLETSPWSYLADESDGPNLLAAEIFYQRLAGPSLKEASFKPVTEAAKPSGAETPAAVETPPDLGSYGEPGGPRRRCDVVMSGLSVGGRDTSPHTLTALVTNREGKLRLLLGGVTRPAGMALFQPAPAHGGGHDSIGAVERQVVFIDDLDRCDPKKAVEVLEAIKLLLDLDRFIVFLALDARIITQAVEEYYGKVLVEAEITGYEYLDKIVQIPFSIPEPPPYDLRQYIGSLIGLDATDIPPLEPPAPPAETAPLAAQQVQSVAAGPATTVPPLSPSPDEAKEPPAPRKEVEVQVDAAEVVFTRGEQETFLGFYSHLDPNPRRIKRLVNIYRLVRALIDSRRRAQAAGAAPPADLPDNPCHTLGWLVVCEQWPYAAHVMLEDLDRGEDQAGKKFKAQSALATLNKAAQRRIAKEGNKALQKLDLKYDHLQSFIQTYLSDFTVADLKRLRPYTVNFNPALSAEVQLTLARGNP